MEGQLYRLADVAVNPSTEDNRAGWAGILLMFSAGGWQPLNRSALEWAVDISDYENKTATSFVGYCLRNGWLRKWTP